VDKIYKFVWKLEDDIEINQCMGNLPNKHSWTFNGVIFSHPREFKRDLCEIWKICPNNTVGHIFWACNPIKNKYFKKHVTLMNSEPEPAKWSRDTGQRIPCFDSGQLTITWTSNIKDVSMVMVLLTYFSRYWAWHMDVPGAGENTLGRLALFSCLDHPPKSDVTSGKKAGWAAKLNLNAT